MSKQLPNSQKRLNNGQKTKAVSILQTWLVVFQLQSHPYFWNVEQV